MSLFKSDCTIDVNISGLNNLMKAFKTKGYVKIGILGENNIRGRGESNKKKKATNAEIGVVHEFGNKAGTIPPRSFLRMPIQHESKIIMKKMRSYKEKISKGLISGKITIFFDYLAIESEAAIQRAFESAGFGNWKYAQGTSSNLKTKKVSRMPLIQTGQLRGSIDSKVVISGS